MEITSLNQIKKDHNIDIGVGSIISNAFKMGFQNWGRLLLGYILFILVFWVPYINIGAYIGLTGFIVTISKGRKISPSDIFDSYYLKKIGDYALLFFLFLGGIIGLAMILWNLGSYIALFTGVFPLIVIFYSWSMSGLLLLDKDLGALKSIELSNGITYQYKGAMFGANIIMGLIFFAISLFMFGLMAGVFALIDNMYDELLITIILIFFVLLCIAILSLMMSIFLAGNAYIYRVLEKRISIESCNKFKTDKLIADNKRKYEGL